MRLLLRFTLTFAALLGGTPASQAQTNFPLPYTAAWEASDTARWTQNPLAAQNNWTSNTDLDGFRVVGSTTLAGKTIVPQAGSQMAQIQTSYRGGFFRVLTPDPVSLAVACRNALIFDTALTLESDFYLPSSEASKDGWQGLCFFNNASPRTELADILLQNSTQKLRLTSRGVTTVANAFPRDQWFHVQLMLDFTNQIAAAYVNGNLVAADAAHPISTMGMADGSGSIGYGSLCSVSPAADASGSPYNNNAHDAGDGYTAPQAIAFADNLQISSAAQADAVTGSLQMGIAFDSVSDLTAAPAAIPPGMAPDTAIGDLVPSVHIALRPMGSANVTIEKTLSLTEMTGSIGYLNLYGLPNGFYDMAVKPAASLQIVWGGFEVTPEIQYLPVLEYPGGDADGSNVVDFDDFLALLNAFGGTADNPAGGYDASADFNFDGTVNFDDFLILLGNFGVQGDTL